MGIGGACRCCGVGPVTVTLPAVRQTIGVLVQLQRRIEQLVRAQRRWRRWRREISRHHLMDRPHVRQVRFPRLQPGQESIQRGRSHRIGAAAIAHAVKHQRHPAAAGALRLSHQCLDLIQRRRGQDRFGCVDVVRIARRNAFCGGAAGALVATHDSAHRARAAVGADTGAARGDDVLGVRPGGCEWIGERADLIRIPGVERLQVATDRGPLGGIGQRGKVDVVGGVPGDLVAIGIECVELGLRQVATARTDQVGVDIEGALHAMVAQDVAHRRLRQPVVKGQRHDGPRTRSLGGFHQGQGRQCAQQQQVEGTQDRPAQKSLGRSPRRPRHSARARRQEAEGVHAIAPRYSSARAAQGVSIRCQARRPPRACTCPASRT